MSRKRHSAVEIVNKLRQADVELGRGKSVIEVCRVTPTPIIRSTPGDSLWGGSDYVGRVMGLRCGYCKSITNRP